MNISAEDDGKASGGRKTLYRRTAMTTVTKELNLLDAEDVERSVSERLGRTIRIREMECRLNHRIPFVSGEPGGAYLVFKVGEEACDSYDLFWDKEREGHFLRGRRLSLDEAWASAADVFSFDVSGFKQFDSWIDTSD